MLPLISHLNLHILYSKQIRSRTEQCPMPSDESLRRLRWQFLKAGCQHKSWASQGRRQRSSKGWRPLSIQSGSATVNILYLILPYITLPNLLRFVSDLGNTHRPTRNGVYGVIEWNDTRYDMMKTSFRYRKILVILLIKIVLLVKRRKYDHDCYQ